MRFLKGKRGVFEIIRGGFKAPEQEFDPENKPKNNVHCFLCNKLGATKKYKGRTFHKDCKKSYKRLTQEKKTRKSQRKLLY